MYNKVYTLVVNKIILLYECSLNNTKTIERFYSQFFSIKNSYLNWCTTLYYFHRLQRHPHQRHDIIFNSTYCMSSHLQRKGWHIQNIRIKNTGQVSKPYCVTQISYRTHAFVEIFASMQSIHAYIRKTFIYLHLCWVYAVHIENFLCIYDDAAHRMAPNNISV